MKHTETEFLQWALPKLGYRWGGFRKPRVQVIKRIRKRIRELNLQDLSAYRDYLDNHPDEWKILDSFCDITITRFFRDRKVWDYFRDVLLPDVISKHPNELVSIWSAGCCNGEEPYSIAITLSQLIDDSQSNSGFRILATDRNPEQIRKAKDGWYPPGVLKELSSEETEKYFSPDESGYRIDPALIKIVEFEVRDIRYSLPERQFHFIFCRNLVFTYFSNDLQRDYLTRFRSLLHPDGFLITGAQEKPPEADWLKKVHKSHPVYQKCEGS